MKVYVGNLSYEVGEGEIREAFEAFGQVESVNLITDRSTGESKGFGFVEMPSKEEANAAIEELNGKELKGRPMNVNEARPRPEKPQYGGGGRGGRGGGGGRPQGRGGRGGSGGGGRPRGGSRESRGGGGGGGGGGRRY